MVQLKLVKVVKMKKFIISYMCILLFSCRPVTNPAYADVVEQDSIIFPVSSEKQEYIPGLTIADFSFTAMLAHQNGVSEEAQLSLAPVPTTQDEAMLKVILDGIIHDANVFPVYDDISDKIEVSERFSNVIYDICKEDK